MVRVLFVCLGNICRSPLAEGIMQKKIREANLQDQVKTDSCGTSQYHIGDQPDKRTIRNAQKNDLFLDHKARQFTTSDFSTFHYIIVMDRSNLEFVQNLDSAGEFSQKLHLMRDFDPDGKGADVPDPFFGGEEGFQDVYQILERSVDAFLYYLIKKHDLKTEVD